MNACEKFVDDAERVLRARQLCTYWKIPNDLETLKKTPCDFIGHTIRGRAILIECKATSAPRVAVPHARGIKGHQWVALRDAHRCGAISAIVWLHGDEIAVIPFPEAERLLASRRSIPWPGGLSLETDEPVLVVVRALVQVLMLGAKLADGPGQMIDGLPQQGSRVFDRRDRPDPCSDDCRDGKNQAHDSNLVAHFDIPS